ncbi:MAG: Thioesterase-like superfamily [Actinomycetota bacterium]|nr:Thioesterase-like superfamily [Actinomycetota bacterium]
MGVTARSRGTTALHDEGYRFVVPIEPKPTDYDAQGHLNNAAIVRIFNDIRIAYVQQRLGDRWREHLGSEGLVVVAREVHVLYESEGLPTDEYVGAMRYVRREGRAAIIEQRLTEETSARAVAQAWVVQLLVRDGSVADWPDFYFTLVAEIEGREIEQRPGLRRPWGPGP